MRFSHSSFGKNFDFPSPGLYSALLKPLVEKKKNGMDYLIYKAEIETQTQTQRKKGMDSKAGERGWDEWGDWG